MTTITEQITEVEREIETRKRVYPKWVSEKRITQQIADQRVACMQSVLETLRLVRCLKENG
jgi:hypothetical protein